MKPLVWIGAVAVGVALFAGGFLLGGSAEEGERAPGSKVARPQPFTVVYEGPRIEVPGEVQLPDLKIAAETEIEPGEATVPSTTPPAYQPPSAPEPAPPPAEEEEGTKRGGG